MSALHLIEQLRQLCKDNEGGDLPVILIEHVLRDYEAKQTYQHAARRIGSGGALVSPGGPHAQFVRAQQVVADNPEEYEMVRRVVFPESAGEWHTF